MNKTSLELVLAFSLCFAGAFSASSQTGENDQPFGAMQFVAPQNSGGWDQWRRIKTEVLAKIPHLQLCHDKPENCTPAERKFEAIVIEAEAQQGIARIDVVNRRINGSIVYTPDIKQWGVADKWSAPFETDGKGSFQTGKGDCEDYAAAKFVALYQVGVHLTDMRVVLVHDSVINLDHAVLAVRSGKRWLILENRHDELYDDKVYNTFRPLLVVDSEGVGKMAKPFRLSDLKAMTPCAR